LIPRVFVTGQQTRQYICHITLSGENITAEKLKQRPETNNPDTANKSRDVFFKENVKQGDVSVLYNIVFKLLFVSYQVAYLLPLTSMRRPIAPRMVILRTYLYVRFDDEGKMNLDCTLL
jgi:hypothetical protein